MQEIFCDLMRVHDAFLSRCILYSLPYLRTPKYHGVMLRLRSQSGHQTCLWGANDDGDSSALLTSYLIDLGDDCVLMTLFRLRITDPGRHIPRQDREPIHDAG